MPGPRDTGIKRFKFNVILGDYHGPFSDTPLIYPPLDWLTLSMLNCFMHQWPTRGISLRAIGVTLSWPEASVSSLSKFKCKNCNANVDNTRHAVVYFERGRAASEIVFQISSARTNAFASWTIRQKVCEVRFKNSLHQFLPRHYPYCVTTPEWETITRAFLNMKPRKKMF